MSWVRLSEPPSTVVLSLVSTDFDEVFEETQASLGVIMDGCRDHVSKGKKGVDSAFASAPQNGFIAFACKPGESSFAGDAKSCSQYTAALLRHIAKPIDVNQLFRLVCTEVSAATGERQVPWYNESIKQEYWSLHSARPAGGGAGAGAGSG
jgi:hypothetical protein